MTGEEQDLLIAYLVDAGEIFPDLDVDMEDQFLDWYQVRQGVVSGEAHYKAILEAARVRKRSLERGVAGAPAPDVRPPGRLRPRRSLRLLRRRARRRPGPGIRPTPERPTGRHGWDPPGPGPRQRVGGGPPGLSCRSPNAGPRPGRSGTPAPETWKTGFAGP